MRKRITRADLAWVVLGVLAAARPAPCLEFRPGSVAVGTGAALPPDVATIGGIVRAYYEVISGPAGQPRQWARDPPHRSPVRRDRQRLQHVREPPGADRTRDRARHQQSPALPRRQPLVDRLGDLARRERGAENTERVFTLAGTRSSVERHASSVRNRVES